MSYTSIYALYKTKVVCIGKLQDSKGIAQAIWDYTSIKLRGKETNMLRDSAEFLPRWKSDKLDDDERAVLLSTYDYSFVEVTHLEKFAAACSKVHNLIISTTDWKWSNFCRIGEIAINLNETHNYRCKGLSVGCTSVCDPWPDKKTIKENAWGIYNKLEKLKLKKTAGKIEG